MSKSRPLAGVLLLLLAAFLAVGTLTFASPCEAGGDGGPAPCHALVRVVVAIDVVLGVLALVRVFEMDEGERRGLSLACACLGVLIACVPGPVVDLCVSSGARCQELTRPFVMAVGAAVAVVGGTDLARRLLSLRDPNRKGDCRP